ncbi:hypothetical protein BpHYR1_011388 [Brachionus plicatilis]|uniref:Secreted protein n=1 Tax=Brachionus plicatilis TaxID=10195 RepID=A0A3M7SK95_BRAPC|nr:hypothetical protein BpHYR1_011388 [Brachionus plicatilis]
MSKISFVFSWLLITGIFSVPLDYPDRYDTTLPWSTTTTRVYCTLSCYPNSYEDYQDCTCHCYPGYYFDQSLYQCAQVLTDQNLFCKLKQLIYPLYQEYSDSAKLLKHEGNQSVKQVLIQQMFKDYFQQMKPVLSTIKIE